MVLTFNCDLFDPIEVYNVEALLAMQLPRHSAVSKTPKLGFQNLDPCSRRNDEVNTVKTPRKRGR